jgi:molybdate transport system ATP-binding protein
MSLEFAASFRQRGFEVEFALADGETLAILGPNGAGKSTLMNLLSGLLRPDAGRAVLDGRTLFDVGAGARREFRPPHERRVAMLAQDALLFPHLNARDNVAFGARSTGRSKREAHQIAHDWLAEVDASELAGRRPAQLSGGQAQRIAVARALAAQPTLLLLDEPMAALDVSVAPALRRMLGRVLEGRMAIIVTHDILDAFTLADRVIVMDGGAIIDSGPTYQVLERPTHPFTAGLAAMNLVPGTGQADGISTADGVRIVATTDERLRPGASGAVAVRPTLVTVSIERPDAQNGVNTVAGTVTDLEQRGDIIRVRTELLAADVPPRLVAQLDLAHGTRVWCSFRAADAVAYPI